MRHSGKHSRVMNFNFETSAWAWIFQEPDFRGNFFQIHVYFCHDRRWNCLNIISHVMFLNTVLICRDFSKTFTGICFVINSCAFVDNFVCVIGNGGWQLKWGLFVRSLSYCIFCIVAFIEPKSTVGLRNYTRASKVLLQLLTPVYF